MAHRNLRCQVTNATVAALPPIPWEICISDIATVMTNVMLSTAAELAQSFNPPRGAQGRCGRAGVETEINKN